MASTDSTFASPVPQSSVTPPRHITGENNSPSQSTPPTPEALMAALDENQPFYTRQGENYLCNLCDKSFNYKNGLIRHLRLTHGKEKPFECNICHRRFGYKNILMEHQNIHFGIKPYACNLCDKRFAARSNLVQHKLVHRKPLSCSICTKRFDKPEQLQRHLLGHPGGYLSCNLCKFTTANQMELNEHIQKNHPPQVMNTRDKVNSLLDGSCPMETNCAMTSAPSLSPQKGTLPQFGIAFNFAKSLSGTKQVGALQTNSCPSPLLSSTAPVPSSSSEAVECNRRIDSICAQLASKTPPTSLPHSDLMKVIKQEPLSPQSETSHFLNHNIGTVYGQNTMHTQNMFPEYSNGLQDNSSSMQNLYAQKVHTNRDTRHQHHNSLPSSEESVVNVEAAQTTTNTNVYRNTREQADSTSNVSDVLSMLQSLAQQSSESGPPGSFPQISITISPAKHNMNKSVQCTQQNPNTPGLRETLAYYESQGSIYRCQHCRILFEERGLYFLHMALHGSTNPWQCSICNSVLLDRNDFHLHLINQQHCQKS